MRRVTGRRSTAGASAKETAKPLSDVANDGSCDEPLARSGLTSTAECFADRLFVATRTTPRSRIDLPHEDTGRWREGGGRRTAPLSRTRLRDAETGRGREGRGRRPADCLGHYVCPNRQRDVRAGEPD